eukprot:Opistho-1_new@28849
MSGQVRECGEAVGVQVHVPRLCEVVLDSAHEHDHNGAAKRDVRDKPLGEPRRRREDNAVHAGAERLVLRQDEQHDQQKVNLLRVQLGGAVEKAQYGDHQRLNVRSREHKREESIVTVQQVVEKKDRRRTAERGIEGGEGHSERRALVLFAIKHVRIPEVREGRRERVADALALGRPRAPVIGQDEKEHERALGHGRRRRALDVRSSSREQVGDGSDGHRKEARGGPSNRRENVPRRFLRWRRSLHKQRKARPHQRRRARISHAHRRGDDGVGVGRCAVHLRAEEHEQAVRGLENQRARVGGDFGGDDEVPHVLCVDT